MTDRKEALLALIAQLEAGEPDSFAAIVPGRPTVRGYAESAYYGSLDAAKALHEAVLPGWAVQSIMSWPGHSARVGLLGTHEFKGGRWHNAKDGKVEAEAETIARAWLIAILRALAEEA